MENALEAMKELWFLILGAVTYITRMEVGQSLNKQRLKHLNELHEKSMREIAERQEKNNAAIHSRLGRHEDNMAHSNEIIQSDIKSILSKLS